MADGPRIVRTPGTCSGAPRISGTRLRVTDVLGALRDERAADAVRVYYPHLTTEQIDAVLAYAVRAVKRDHVARLRSEATPEAIETTLRRERRGSSDSPPKKPCPTCAGVGVRGALSAIGRHVMLPCPACTVPTPRRGT